MMKSVESKPTGKRGGPRAGAGGARAGAGRPQGAVNAEKKALKELAQVHSESAVKTLADIMLDTKQPGAVRVSAASVLLDRGHGRPIQNLELEIDSRGFTPAEKEELALEYAVAEKNGVWARQKAEMKERKKSLECVK
jgi:hypothetical protein